MTETTSPSDRRGPWLVGILGCGRMGRLHAERLHSDGRAEVVALFDVHEAAAAGLQKALAPSARIAASGEELLADPRLDAVVICTPTDRHFAEASAALERGLHVLCEKPLADARSRLEELIALAARTTGQHAVLAYQRRFWANYRTLRREVQSGRWGSIQAVTSHNTERWQQTIGGTWRDDPRQNPGGFLGDAGSHKLDALFYVTGHAPLEAFARSRRCGSSVEILTSVSAVLEEDIPLTMDFVGSANHQAEDLTIHCAEADLMVRDWRVWIARDNILTPLEPMEPHTEPAVGFLDVLEGKAKNPAPFSAARPVFDLTEMILESARQGTTVQACRR
jgi:predicted dehydrogenase